MIHKLQSSHSSSRKIIGLAALLIVTILLASCPPPAPTPTPPDDMDPGNGMDDPGNGMDDPGNGMDAPPLTTGDFELPGLRRKVTDIFSDGSTMWVLYGAGASGVGGKILAYKMIDKTRDTSKDFPALPGTSYPNAIWANEDTMWVTSGHNIRAFKMSDKTRDTSKEFSLTLPSTARPAGIWGNATTMWVTEPNTMLIGGGAGKIYAYHMGNKMPDTAKDIDNLGSGGATTLWANDTTMFVLNTTSKIISAYNLDSRTEDETKRISLDGRNASKRPKGIWSDGTTIWVGEGSESASTGRDKLRAYNLMTGDRTP